MRLKDFGLLLLLAAFWGGAFLLTRLASPVIGPVLLVEVRLILAALFLLGYLAATRQLSWVGRRWPDFVFLGAVNVSIPFVLVSAAELHLTSSLAAIVNSTAPIFTAIVGVLWAKDKLTLGAVTGLVLGLVGVGILAGFGPVPLTPALAWSMLASLAAAALYGVGAYYAKLRTSDLPVNILAFYTMVFAAVTLAPAVPFAPRPQHPVSLAVAVSVVLLAVFSTAVGYLLYFRLIDRVGPAKTALVSYLSPAFGMFFGVLLLDEHLNVSSFVAVGLILFSVALVGRGRKSPAGESPGLGNDEPAGAAPTAAEPELGLCCSSVGLAKPGRLASPSPYGTPSSGPQHLTSGS